MFLSKLELGLEHLYGFKQAQARAQAFFVLSNKLELELKTFFLCSQLPDVWERNSVQSVTHWLAIESMINSIYLSNISLSVLNFFEWIYMYCIVCI